MLSDLGLLGRDKWKIDLQTLAQDKQFSMGAVLPHREDSTVSGDVFDSLDWRREGATGTCV